MSKKTYPSVLSRKKNVLKTELLKSWETLLNDKDTKQRAKELEDFIKKLFSLSSKHKLRVCRRNFEDKQIDFTAENQGLLPNEAGGLLYGECKYYSKSKAGAPACYKIAGHMLFNKHIKTAFVVSISGFAETAYPMVDKFSQEKKTLILIDSSKIENYLKSNDNFEDWFNELYNSARWAEKTKVEKPLLVKMTDK